MFSRRDHHIEAMHEYHQATSGQLAIDMIKNGARLVLLNMKGTTIILFLFFWCYFKVGDYLQVDQNTVTTSNIYHGEPGECNVRIFRV